MNKNLYNGWKGRPFNTGAFTWLVNLHLSNDKETMGDMDAALIDAIETAKEEKARGDYGSLTAIAIRVLASRLNDYVDALIDDLRLSRKGFAGLLASDLVSYAIAAADFQDIAETMIEDYKSAGGAELNEGKGSEEDDVYNA